MTCLLDRVLCTGVNRVGTRRCVPIREVSSFQRALYVQASMEVGPEDVSLLERCSHIRGCLL